VLGNHELYGDDKAALAHFFGRFPHLGQRRWYSFTWRDVAFILLDSNLEEMGPEETKGQMAWYQAELARFEADEAVGCIVVACHKPPFTNSKVVGASEKVRAGFVPAFLSAEKARLFLSGHCHSYERFSVEGKTFIVSGGGGGPRHRLYRDPMTRPFNDLFDGPDLRFFHFCEVQWRQDGLAIRVIRLDQDGTFQEVDPLFLPKKTAGNRSQDLYLSPAHFAR
jgi:3',5'-cyclic AMP phosphodiesterase CpdA